MTSASRGAGARFLRDKNIEKPVKVYLCVILGLILTRLMGHPNTITIPVTALLVVGTGQNSSKQGVRLYVARRVFIQILGTALLILPLLYLKIRLSLAPWLVVLLACAIPLVILFCIDYRWHISPMYITSVSVSTLILATGMVQSTRYPLTRILLVFTGGLLGYVLSAIVFPRDHGADAEASLEESVVRLEKCLQAVRRGDLDEGMRLLRQSDALFTGASASLANVTDGEQRKCLTARKENLQSLRYALSLWISWQTSPDRRTDPEQEYLNQVEYALSAHRSLASGAIPEGSPSNELGWFLLGTLQELR